MFPKIIAGPIVRYRDVIPQIRERVLSADGLAEGARRFIIGLAKKVLVADTLGLVVDRGVFSFSPAQPAGRCGLAGYPVLRLADLLRFLRVYRHGDWDRADARV